MNTGGITFKRWSKHVPKHPLVEILRGEGTLVPCGSFLRSMVLWSLHWMQNDVGLHTIFYIDRTQQCYGLSFVRTRPHTQNGDFTYFSGARGPGGQDVKAAHQGTPCPAPPASLSVQSLRRKWQRNARLHRLLFPALGREQHLDHFNLR